MDRETLQEKWCDVMMVLAGPLGAARMLVFQDHLRELASPQDGPEVRAATAKLTKESEQVKNLQNLEAALSTLEMKCAEAEIDLIDLVRLLARRIEPWFIPVMLDYRHAIRNMRGDDL